MSMYIKTMTDAYLEAYLRAMEKTGNQYLSTQAAFSVCTMLNQAQQNEAQMQMQSNPMGDLLAALMRQITGDGQEGDEDDE